MLSAEFIQLLQNLIPPDRLYFDPVDCYAYAYDNSRKYFPPECVIFPLTTDEVVKTIQLCNQFKVPLTPRGRGTGTAGGSLTEQGGASLSLERMIRIISIDTANRVLVAEPGVLNESVQAAVKPYGFFWPPDPSSAAFSSIGGNLATCAGGPHAVKYGTTRDHVLGLTAVTGQGNIIKTGCYTTKGVVGYDLTRLLVGSEGTLAVITEATLKLTPLPAAKSGLVAHYQDTESCASAIATIMKEPQGPSALEFLDSGSLDLIRSRNPGMLPDDSRAMLMIEIDGTKHEIFEIATRLLAACQNSGLLKALPVQNTADLWKARKTLSPLLRDIAPKKINEDIVVPVDKIPQLLAGLSSLCKRYQIPNVNFGHAGNGNLHINLLIDPDNPGENANAYQCLNQIFDLVISLNGTLSGEHGIGSEKRPYIDKELNEATLTLMKQIKLTFDPCNILNPGKLFP
ncbi:FAD-binding protein [Nitrosomonas sp. HPC101]|uniref:FAD-binding oxidoreductase n=1 Tax=Nitrosomonas sp. HPC101 TaxID=1658667 RepID=UPI001368C17C|nr:FAD-linked oxidase C-terminal domain-containing protein [Nitrosomonas sp. HPC101]MXS84849.1 FAD-binding protein [Nitrosomonas sp. HPC101]